MLSPDQIIEISKAALISRAQAATLTASFDSYDTDAMSDALDRWATLKNKFSYLNGKIAGYVTETDKQRLAVRNEIRGSLGLSLLTDELQTAREFSFEDSSSSNVDNEFVF